MNLFKLLNIQNINNIIIINNINIITVFMLIVLWPPVMLFGSRIFICVRFNAVRYVQGCDFKHKFSCLSHICLKEA